MSKRNDIINSARELFTTFGFKKVSMDEIAKKANVTKRTVYSYYKDKQELFEYFILEELEEIKNKLDEKKEERFLDRVAYDLNSILTLSNSSLLSSLIKEKKEEKKSDFFTIYENKIINYIEEKIKIEVSNKNINVSDAHLTAFIIYKTIFSIIFEYDKKVDKNTLIDEVTKILKNGLLNKEVL